MSKTKDQTAAMILGWVLLPFALLDIGVLLIACAAPTWYLPIALFAILYMVPALVIWGLLVVLAYSRRSLRFVRITWGGHVGFNIAATLLWLGNAFANQTADPTSLYPLVITLPVLGVTGYFFRRTFTP